MARWASACLAAMFGLAGVGQSQSPSTGDPPHIQSVTPASNDAGDAPLLASAHVLTNAGGFANGDAQTAGGSPPLADTLADFEALALANHPAIRSAIAAVAAARGQAQQAGLGPNPTLQGGSPQWGGDSSMYGAYLSQEIVTAHKLRLDRQAALQGVLQAEADLVAIRFQLLSEVRSQFYRTLALQRRVEALGRIVELSKRSYETSQKLTRGGEGTRVDELQLRIQYRRATATAQATAAELDAAKRRLSAVVGLPDLVVHGLEGDLAAALPDFEYEPALDGIFQENSRIQRAQLEIARQRVLLRRARVEPIPNLTLQGGYQYQAQEPNNQPLAFISVPVPLWNRNQGAVSASRALVSKAAADLQATQYDLAAQAAEAIGRFRSAQDLVREFEAEILPAAQTTVDLTHTAYQGGQFSFLQLLQAQRDLFQATLDYIDAQEIRWQAAVDLARLMQIESFPPPVGDR